MEKKVEVVVFDCDQNGIDKLKIEFINESENFCYFRKGEGAGLLLTIDTTHIEALSNTIKIIIENKDIVTLVPTIIVAYPASKELVSDISKKAHKTVEYVKKFLTKLKQEKKCVDGKLICSKGSLKKPTISKWEEMFGSRSIVTIPKSKIGNFRFIVNEKRYALFARISPTKLQGIIGSDKETIKLLQNLFLKEFNSQNKGKNEKNV